MTAAIANTATLAIREYFYAATASATQFQFPNGLVFPAGESVTFYNFGDSLGGNVTVTVHGYLTSN